jgi:DNA-binding transcriptional LysR family regulator
LDLRQLEHFVAVADEQHFTRAAQKVHIVQSALSTSIRALEIELGAQLFVRSTRSVKLTPAGKALYGKAVAVLAGVREARVAVEAVQGLERGSLTIGVVQSIGPFLNLAELLGTFRADHPGIEIRVYQGSTTSLMEDVRSARLDLAIVPLFEPLHDVATIFIACEPLVVACAPNHPLAGTSDVSLARLANEPFVDFLLDWGTRRIVDRAFSQAGVERRTMFEVSDLQTAFDLVARGLGIALLPKALVAARAASATPDLLAIAHVQEEICWELVVAHRESEPAGALKNPAAEAFLALVKQVTELFEEEEESTSATGTGTSRSA